MKHIKLFTLALSLVLIFAFVSCGQVKFDVNFIVDGEVYDTISTSGGAVIELPANPTKDNYTFDGWYWDKDTWDKPFTANSLLDAPLSSEMNVYAKWLGEECVVSLDANGGEVSKSSITVSGGDKISLPEPKYDGYKFLGWFDENDNEIKSGTVITSNMELTAKWELNSFVVTFNANGGTVSTDKINVERFTAIGQLPVPKRDGYIFTGWYEADDTLMEDQVKKSTLVANDMELVASWERDENTVAIFFDLNGGNVGGKKEIDVLYIAKGTIIGNRFPSQLEHEHGADFIGWYDKNDVRVDAVTKANKDMTIIAKWTELVECGSSGSYRHNWSPFIYDNERTCTKGSEKSHICLDCGYKEIIPDRPALGHDYALGWTYSALEQTLTCDRCGHTETIKYKNVANTAVDDITIEGAVYGPDNENCLINDNWDETFGTTFAGKNNSPLTVTLTLRASTDVDHICVKGAGSYGYIVSVLYEGDSEYTTLGRSSFGKVIGKFSVDGPIVAVMVHMPDSGMGTDYWQEIALVQIPR